MMHSEILAEDLEMPDILFQRENSDTFFKKPEKGWKCPMSYFSNSVIAERFEPGGDVIHVAPASTASAATNKPEAHKDTVANNCVDIWK